MTVRWGIAGTGRIAGDFAKALRRVPDAKLAAVASRSQDRAEVFARERGAQRAYSSLEGMLADDSIDVVYVASPHSEHCAQAVAALEAGKHVLCEKPLAVTTAEAELMVATARRTDRLLMEALWSRFLPAYVRMKELADTGALGEIRGAAASFGFVAPDDGPQRLADPALAGGALLDLGVYPVSFAHLVLGGFTTVQAVGTLAATGVDESETIAVTSAAGAIGTLSTTMSAVTPIRATVAGTRARLDVDGWFYQPNTVRLVAPDGTELDRVDPPARDHGLAYQAAEFARLLADGRTESDLLPLAETVQIMRVMDAVRAQLGVRYPGEA